MIVQDCYSFIQIGLAIRLLRNIGSHEAKRLARNSIDMLIDRLKECNLIVTMAFLKSENVIKIQEDIKALANEETIIGDSLSKRIRDEFYKVEPVVFAESSIKKVYVLPGRRFNAEYLLNDPGKLLKDGVFQN